MESKRAVLIGAGAIAALAISAGCNSSSDSGAGPSAQKTGSSATATTAPASQDHNDADVMFAHHMIPHHQQAIEMSDAVLGKQGIDSRVTGMAKQIKAAQGPEINEMQGWLSQWGNPPMPAMTPGGGHGDHDMGGTPGTSGMPGNGMGMMSAEQMTALKNATGVDASKQFLTGMITHHEGAITMAQDEIRDGRFPPAIELSHSIVQSQQEEIDTMKGILATL